MPEPTDEVTEVADQVADLTMQSPAVQKKLEESRGSISSVDSDMSFGFDRDHRDGKLENEDEGAHMADLSDSASDSGSRDSGGKDSGCEVTPEITEPPFTPPTDELADKIVAQVEFYFSDPNITKDAFLLKHVKRNKEGYVSLKLISSFKRVKHLTKDWRVVAHALARSTKLEINEAGTKLRRKDPLPQYDETTPSRTIVAVHMPLDKVTIENVADLFKTCGEISLIRVLRPGNPIPADVRQFINKNPSLNGLTCALVEFVASESARNAIQLQEIHGEPMKVYELNGVPNNVNERKKKTNKNSKTKQQQQQQQQQQQLQKDFYSSSEAEDYYRSLRMDHPRLQARRASANFPPRTILEPAAWLQRRLSASSTEAHFMYMTRRKSYGSRESNDSAIFIPRRYSNCSLSSNDSFFQRRMSTVSVSSSEASSGSGPRSRSNSTQFHLPENIVRMPQGPDGSKGFRPRLQTIAN